MPIALIHSSDSLKILELQQRNHDLEIQTRSFWDAMPIGLTIFGLILGAAITIMTIFYVIGIWDKIYAPYLILKLKREIRQLAEQVKTQYQLSGENQNAISNTLLYLGGMAKYQSAQHFKENRPSAFFYQTAEAIKMLYDSNMYSEDTTKIVAALHDELKGNITSYVNKISTVKDGAAVINEAIRILEEVYYTANGNMQVVTSALISRIRDISLHLVPYKSK
jgi:hypothetical protein